MTTDIPAALVERVEAEAYAEFEGAASPAARAALGTRAMRIGGGIALAMPGDPTGFWSKTLGLGFDEPITVRIVEDVIEFYREQGMPSAALMIAPGALPADWAGICARLGIRESPPGQVKLVGDLGELTVKPASAHLDVGLRVARVSAAQVKDWARVQFEAFGFPADPQQEMALGVYGKPGWHAFAVFDGEDVIAAANLYVNGTVASLFGCAALPQARRRGAQSALIAARIEAARHAGCDWVLGETGAEEAGEHNSSLHNMVRGGLNVRYVRQTWTWRKEAQRR